MVYIFLRNELRRRSFNYITLNAGGLLRAVGTEPVLVQCGLTLVQKNHSIETGSKQQQQTNTNNAETKPTTTTTKRNNRTRKQQHKPGC